ncbi:GMC oxidoreductase [Granulicella sp. dw_53]|uniref:GMC family oxidoreductase n=1 Tax=Granulicella sp. dw_53 TaxID=2719792 RepID=UPI001BD51EF0|nr:GMC oxidoreductase [Granulicella sp. dw_53]
MADEIYDFVVIGSGAGGGPVATNLARAGYTVLVLEAGEDNDNYNYRVPAFNSLASEDPAMSWDFFVRHYDDQAMQRRDSKYVAERDGVFYPRAGTLGGCTAHNAMIMVYPFNSDWENIRELVGDDSWSAESMRSYFERLEHCDYLSEIHRSIEAVSGLLHGQGTHPARHGFSGWLHTERVSTELVLKDLELLKVIVEAAATGLAHHLGDLLLDLETFLDPNDWRFVTSKNREAVFPTPLATHRGIRNGTRELLLEAVKDTGGKLSIRTGALASKIVFDEDRRAVAVEYLVGPGLYKASRSFSADAEPSKVTVRARHEIILSGGAFNSPQLLMLSGVGDEAELRKFGITPVVSLPGVGKNLQDRYEVGVVSKMMKPFGLLKGATFTPPVDGAPVDATFADWEQGKGVYTTSGATIAVTKRSSPERADPDLLIFALPAYFKGYYPGYSKATERYHDKLTWAILKARTNNTAGEVKLRSNDPRDTPSIHFHYFGEGNDASGDDLRAVVEGVKFAREMNRHIEKKVGMEEQVPGPAISSDEEIADFIRREAWGHHASCTNRMGPKEDPMAVLDSRFRVHGTKGLRVVDASVFPRIPGFFIVSAVYMIAEKASDVILEDVQAAEGAKEGWDN